MVVFLRMTSFLLTPFLKESTSSSPSSRHIGHYKVAVNDPTLDQLHSCMMSFPFMHGFAPDRWKRVTDIMLEKEPGIFPVSSFTYIGII